MFPSSPKPQSLPHSVEISLTHTHTHTYTGQILGFHSFQQGAAGWCHKARRKGSEECVSLGSDKSDSSPRKWLANALGVQDLAQLTVSLLHLWTQGPKCPLRSPPHADSCYPHHRSPGLSSWPLPQPAIPALTLCNQLLKNRLFHSYQWQRCCSCLLLSKKRKKHLQYNSLNLYRSLDLSFHPILLKLSEITSKLYITTNRIWEKVLLSYNSVFQSHIIAFLSDQCKKIEENNRIGKTRDLVKKIRDIKGTFHAQ